MSGVYQGLGVELTPHPMKPRAFRHYSMEDFAIICSMVNEHLCVYRLDGLVLMINMNQCFLVNNVKISGGYRGCASPSARTKNFWTTIFWACM